MFREKILGMGLKDTWNSKHEIKMEKLSHFQDCELKRESILKVSTQSLGAEGWLGHSPAIYQVTVGQLLKLTGPP